VQNLITFPGLGLELNIDRVAFSLFGKDIYWYGIIIAVGFLLAVFYCMKRLPETGLKSDDLIDMLLFAVPACLIGGRAYYVAFMYDQLYYYDHAAMFRIWDGGMAIYGAIIAGVITVVIFAHVKRIRMGAILDLACLGLLIGQAVGRWGNFVNQEAYGSAAENFLRMGIYVNGVLTEVHPTFLYESLWNIVGFVLLHFYFKKRRYSGEVFLLYVAWYGIGRGIIEGLRTDSLYFFGTALRISQFVGFFSAVIAVGIIIYLYLFRERDPETLTNPYLPKRVKKKKGEDEEEAEMLEEDEEEENVTVISGIDFGTADEEADDADHVADDNGGSDDADNAADNSKDN